MTAPLPLSTPRGEQRGHHWRRKRRLRAVQVSQQPITTTPLVLRRKCVVSSLLPNCGGKEAKEIMKHEAQVSGIPALKSNDGEWLLDAQGKANLFAVTFQKMCKLPRLCCSAMSSKRLLYARLSSSVWQC